MGRYQSRRRAGGSVAGRPAVLRDADPADFSQDEFAFYARVRYSGEGPPATAHFACQFSTSDSPYAWVSGNPSTALADGVAYSSGTVEGGDDESQWWRVAWYDDVLGVTGPWCLPQPVNW